MLVQQHGEINLTVVNTIFDLNISHTRDVDRAIIIGRYEALKVAGSGKRDALKWREIWEKRSRGFKSPCQIAKSRPFTEAV